MQTGINIKGEMLNILKVFDEYCKKHGVGYVLGYGTLLGAIRHRGFIPWDDDIDVVLISNQYLKLRKIAREMPYLDDKRRYKFAVPGDKNYCYPFIKVIDTKYVLREKNIADKYNIGLYIDVFRVDYWPKNNIVAFWQLKKARMMTRINEICIRGNIKKGKFFVLDKILRPVDFLFSILGIHTERVCTKLEKVGLKNKKSEYVGNIVAGQGNKKEKISASNFALTTLIPFENMLFPGPDKYDEYLRTIYGDYMKIPDEKYRICHDYEIKINRDFI